MLKKASYLLTIFSILSLITLIFPIWGDNFTSEKPKWFTYPKNVIIEKESGFYETLFNPLYEGPVWYCRFKFQGNKENLLAQLKDVFEKNGFSKNEKVKGQVNSITLHRHLDFTSNIEFHTFQNLSTKFIVLINQKDNHLIAQITKDIGL